MYSTDSPENSQPSLLHILLQGLFSKVLHHSGLSVPLEFKFYAIFPKAKILLKEKRSKIHWSSWWWSLKKVFAKHFEKWSGYLVNVWILQKEYFEEVSAIALMAGSFLDRPYFFSGGLFFIKQDLHIYSAGNSCPISSYPSARINVQP